MLRGNRLFVAYLVVCVSPRGGRVMGSPVEPQTWAQRDGRPDRDDCSWLPAGPGHRRSDCGTRTRQGFYFVPVS